VAMILICPLCNTRFLVAATLFAGGSKRAKCARCYHSWQVDLAKGTAEETPPGSLHPPENTPALKLSFQFPKLKIPEFLYWPVIPSLESLPPRLQRLIKIGGSGVGILLVILWLLLARDWIADRWPVMDKFYGALGLYVDHYHGGEGLAFEAMRSEIVYDGGRTELHLEGKIHNKTIKVQEIPAILATALGADGTVIQSWQIDPPTATVAPDEEAAFTSSINAPKGTVVNINLSFIEKKNASQ